MQKFLHSLFLLILSVFINVNIIDDRFVSPLEDLSHQYQSYELEETTRVLAIQTKKHETMPITSQVPFQLGGILWFSETETRSEQIFYFSIPYLHSHLLNLPPPILV
ncbi:MAG: hypothetical protein O9264_18145 [Leptospira sp.]|jgi:hypothetical protein|nr:hypothetical protein [Leptospira sp.]